MLGRSRGRTALSQAEGKLTPSLSQAEGEPTPPRWSWGATLLGECKGGETWPADNCSCSCLFHNAGFLSRKYYSSYSRSLSDLNVSCRKCVEMGHKHPGLLTRHLPSLFHSPPHTWLWAKPCRCRGGQGGAWSPLTSHRAV